MEQQPIINDHNKQEYPPMHTAEHILNQTMVQMFGCPRSRNAHIERKKSKCDYLLDACPTDEQVKAIEQRVNEVIDRHLDVTVEFVDRDHVPEEVDLTKLPEDASETLRIVRVGDYDVCAIILPQTVINPDATNLRPCKFKATINYVDLDGKEQSYDCENTQFQSNAERVDTVVLAPAFHFPTTNYNQTSDKVSLKINCSITARENARFSREMLLDCIYLRPRTSKPE